MMKMREDEKEIDRMKMREEDDERGGRWERMKMGEDEDGRG